MAAHRAVESARTPGERICYDPLARRFLPAGFTVIGESDIPEETALQIFKDIVPGFHEFFLARTRYIDDRLQEAIANNLEQPVILGAGYDSRAYRIEALKGAKIFEVDHPATQRVKKEKLRKIMPALPVHVSYVPVDFLKDDLSSRLSKKGYEKHLRTLFIWEGVTMYISPESVDKTLSFIADNRGAKSSVIFDYTYADVISGECGRKEANEWLKITEKAGEPLLFGIGSCELEQFLSVRNFCNFKNITSDYFNDNYFTGSNRDRESTPILALAHAEARQR